MKLEVGMYCRTLNGIVKIDKIKDSIMIDTKGKTHFGDFIKVSHNIIDLIEVGDYVNGYKITEIIEKPRKCLKTEYKINLSYVYFCFYEKDIKSIVTKEQFESMAYKVDE